MALRGGSCKPNAGMSRCVTLVCALVDIGMRIDTLVHNSMSIDTQWYEHWWALMGALVDTGMSIGTQWYERW